MGSSTKKKNTSTSEAAINDDKPIEEGIQDTSGMKSLLVNEVKRVANISSTIDVPELKGKTMRVRVKFILQN